MKILVDRKYKMKTYTISNVYVDGVKICDAIEDTDRGLTQDMSISSIQSHKIYGQTAIPSGTYKVTLNVISPKYSKVPFYIQVCKGKVPRLLDVPGYDGVLIHTGNTEKDSLGCIIIGYNTQKGMVTQSREAFKKLYSILSQAKDDIFITIL